MHNPVIALIWESWRLSRRWYLWVLPVAFAFVFLILRQVYDTAAQDRNPNNTLELFATLAAPGVFMVTFALSVFATLLAVSLGNKSGFPLSFEFRLPVKTSVLVMVPMLTLALLCASLYLLPILTYRLVTGVPLPLLPAGALVASLVVILLACGWSTVSSGARTFAMLLGVSAAVQLFGVLDPVDMSPPRFANGQFQGMNPNLVALSPAEYLVLAGMALLLFALTAASIGKQRYGEGPSLQLQGAGPSKARKPTVSLSAVLNRVSDFLLPACPTGAPWRAELWLEARRQVLPILLLSMLIAACVPLLYLAGLAPTAPLDDADYAFPGAVFFVGIGIAVFNRRQASAGYMAAFEGTRGMSTLALGAIQMLSIAGATLIGIALVCVSVHFASDLVDVPGSLELRIREALLDLRERSPAFLLTAAIAKLGSFLGALMFLVCIHTWSVVWGRLIPYGAGILTIYGGAQAIRVVNDRASLVPSAELRQDIENHLWGFAIVILALTLLAFGRTLYTKVLSLRASLGALLCWGIFLACSIYGMTQQLPAFAELSPAMQAFRGAVLTSPLLCFVLLLWSYDRLRHR